MEYAIARLIEAMGMFIHDLAELKNGTDQIYTENAYNSVASSILKIDFQQK